MGFWNNVRKSIGSVVDKVKQGYNKVDSAVGGYLPGGKSPQEVKGSAPKPKQRITTPAYKYNPENSKTPKTSAKAAPTMTFEEGKRSASRDSDIVRSSSSSSRQSSSRPDLSEGGKVVHLGTSKVQQSEEKPGGWSNVKDVLSASFNPFDNTKIIANLDNRVFATPLELLANHPYATASIATGVSMMAHGLTSAVTGTATKAAAKTGIGQLSTAQSAGDWVFTQGATQIAKNTATAAGTAKLLAGIITQLGKPAFVLGAVGAAIGTYPWAEWALGEAKEGMIFNAGKAISTGDPEVIAAYKEVSDEIFDITLWDTIQRSIPGANIAFAFGEKAKALQAQKAVNDKILQDELIAVETGETSDQRWQRVRTEEAEQDKAAIDYYNEQRKIMIEWQNEANAAAAQAARDAARADEVAARNADAEFWRKEAEKQRELEAKDRQAIADFWQNYRITMQKISQNNAPSNLNFGIL